MGNVTIDGLPAATQANNADLFETSQAGVSKKVTRAQLLAGTALTGIVTNSGITMHTGRILGRTTLGQGAIEEIEFVPLSLGGTGASNAANARTNLGLGNVNNTSDADKPVSTAQQTALNGKASTSHGHAIADVSGLQAALDSKLSAGHTHADATISASGFMSAADKTKLNGVASGATANATDAQLRDRSTHTGSQASATISDFSEAVDDRVAALLVAGSNISLTYNDAGNALTVSLAGSPSVSGSLSDAKGNVRDLPLNAQAAAYTAAIGDTGRVINISAGGVTIPAGVFAANHAFSIYNNSGSNQTITQGASVTLRQAGTTNTGNRTLAPYGVATVLCVASNVFVISGAGLT